MKDLISFIPKPVRRGVDLWRDKYLPQTIQQINQRIPGKAGNWGYMKSSLRLSPDAQVVQRSGDINQAYVALNRDSVRTMIERVSIQNIVEGKLSDKHLEDAIVKAGPEEWTAQATNQSQITQEGWILGDYRRNRVQERVNIQERNYGLAATTPVLGQYAPTFDSR